MNIICFSDINWDFLWQRHQQIFSRFPKDWEIIFIQPSLLRILISDPKKAIPYRIDNILIISMIKIPLFDKIGLRRINDLIITIWFKIIKRLYNMKRDSILYFFEPRFSCVIKPLDRPRVIYDIIDDRLNFKGVPIWMSNYIKYLIQNADIVNTTSRKLFEIVKKERKDNLFLIGNGVDVSHLKMVIDDPERSKDIRIIPKPICGYIGSIDEWFDFELLDQVIWKNSEISFVLIGPINPAVADKAKVMEKKFSNLYLLGRKPYELLPYYLKWIDVCIIPFKVNTLTVSVNPTKLYEYLAANKPVVSTNLPEVERYEGDGVVYIAKNRTEFVDKLKYSLNHQPNKEKMDKIANENSWNEIVKKIEKLLSVVS